MFQDAVLVMSYNANKIIMGLVVREKRVMNDA